MTTEYFKVRNGLTVGEDAFTVEASTGDVVVGGNLTVNGTSTTLNTTQLEIEDNIIVLNKNVTGNPTLNGGIVIERGQGTDSALTWNESTDKWEQNRGGVSTTIPVSTTELAEGTNQYFTTQRAIDAVAGQSYATTTQLAAKLATADFTTTANTWLGTRSTSNVTEGSNLYYTATRARAEINGSNPGSFIGLTASGAIDLLDSISVGDATKTGYQGIEFNSNNKTATLVIDHTTGKLIYSKDAVTYTPIAQSTTELAEGTNLYYTDARVGNYLSVNSWATQEYVGVQVANLIASAPSTLNTLNELATALGNDANFATTTATALGTKLATADFTSTANTWLGTKTTANLAENTNLYYTDTRARASNSAGTGVTYDSGTGVISIGQAVGTGDSPTFTTVTATGNVVKGTIRNSTQAAAGDIFALNSSAAQGTTNPYFRGVSLSNSADTTRGPATLLRSYSGSDAANGSAQRGRLIFEKARGTAAAPSAVLVNDVLGSIDVTGYTSTGWLNDTIPAVTGFFGFTAAESYVSNTALGTSFSLNLAPTATTITSGGSLIPVLNLSPQTSTYRGDTHTFQAGKSGSYGFLDMNGLRVLFSVPVKFPAFLATAVNNTLATTAATGTGSVATLTFGALASAPFTLGSQVIVAGMTPSGYNGTQTVTACTTTSVSFASTTTGAQTVAGTVRVAGSVGWQIAVSDSASGPHPNGMMAFWDTTNNRFSYIHDNSAV
jgi:hypothetical protein